MSPGEEEFSAPASLAVVGQSDECGTVAQGGVEKVLSIFYVGEVAIGVDFSGSNLSEPVQRFLYPRLGEIAAGIVTDAGNGLDFTAKVGVCTGCLVIARKKRGAVQAKRKMAEIERTRDVEVMGGVESG